MVGGGADAVVVVGTPDRTGLPSTVVGVEYKQQTHSISSTGSENESELEMLRVRKEVERICE